MIGEQAAQEGEIALVELDLRADPGFSPRITGLKPVSAAMLSRILRSFPAACSRLNRRRRSRISGSSAWTRKCG